MGEIRKIVNEAYRNITKIGFFDIEKGNAPIPALFNDKMADIPEKLKQYVEDCGFGCCFVFSAYMIAKLEKESVNSYMICTLEGDGLRASVLYEDNGEFLVANPVEDIEFFTENNIKPEDRYSYYIGDSSEMVINGKCHNDSCYTLEEFAEKYGTVWLLGKMDRNSNITFMDAMKTKNSRVIMPPECANYDYKKLVK